MHTYVHIYAKNDIHIYKHIDTKEKNSFVLCTPKNMQQTILQT